MASSVPIIIGIALIVIVFIVFLGKQRKKQELSDAHLLLRQNRYREAMDIFLKHKEFYDAAETVVKAPSGSQILLFHRMQNYLEPGRLKSLFLSIGDRYLRSTPKDPLAAAKAYNFAGLPWKSAQTYILEGMDHIDDAISVIDDNPVLIRDRERAIRNLAKFAYENQRIMESAELLRLIGADDEAAAVLVATGKTLDSAPNRRSRVGLDSFVQKVRLATANMKQGKFRDSEEILQKIAPLADTLRSNESDEAQQALQEFTRVRTSVITLRKARQAYKNNRIQEAQVNYSELLDYASEFLPAEVFAEAALSYERTNPELSREYYLTASEKAVTSQAQSAYRNRAQIMLSSVPAAVASSTTASPQSSIPTTATRSTVDSDLPSDPCCICKRPIRSGEVTAKCEHCGTVAHYGHLAEWVKVKGTCPVCRQKIHLDE